MTDVNGMDALPIELIVLAFRKLPVSVLLSGRLHRVCKRWREAITSMGSVDTVPYDTVPEPYASGIWCERKGSFKVVTYLRKEVTHIKMGDVFLSEDSKAAQANNWSSRAYTVAHHFNAFGGPTHINKAIKCGLSTVRVFRFRNLRKPTTTPCVYNEPAPDDNERAWRNFKCPRPSTASCMCIYQGPLKNLPSQTWSEKFIKENIDHYVCVQSPCSRRGNELYMEFA